MRNVRSIVSAGLVTLGALLIAAAVLSVTVLARAVAKEPRRS